MKFGKVTKFTPVGSLVLGLLALAGCTMLALQAPLLYRALPSPSLFAHSFPPEYYSPLENAEYVSKGATIKVRYGPLLSDRNVSDLVFNIQGSKSGLHAGRKILADDHKTVIFEPNHPYTPGETVTVHVSPLQVDDETSYPAYSYTFSVAVNQQPGTPGSSSLAAPPIPPKPPRSAYPNFLTVPQDIPHYTVTRAPAGLDEGYIFVAPFYWTESTVGSYLLILNDQGQLVYYRSVADALDAWDFKEQPNGLLSYYDQKNATFHLMNSNYQTVDTYQAGDGYAADLHDFLILPNGNALLMIYDAETVNMSRIVWGGKMDATVTGLVIQELDPSRNVIFEWRSWDYFSLTDSIASLTTQKIDLIHGNSLALSTDGNLLLSSRNLNEITKIDLRTGDVLWRLGGKANMFKFTDGETFGYQHDVRQLPNGDITVFDNHGTPESLAPSRGIEYALDEANRNVKEVWAFAHAPEVFATYMGNTQRLSDGNTLLSWGAPSTKEKYAYFSITEVTPDNRTIFELVFDQPYVSYRAFRFPWQGRPNTLPALAYKADGSSIVLGYSWNGSTNVAAYRVYGGNATQPLRLLEVKKKTDFETQSRLSNLPANECYFQVAALDKNSDELARSKVISTDGMYCPAQP